ncbi:hypothetical protein [Gluconobacter cerinus]|uniref:hypothetical protein n=1 Tax=Gluconobacter cerinus TaxID=38307 RepID=UPI001B8CAFF0|nr:hypothetical protein [Gluconobacter cerinus]MBS1024753.1 hypothetical protein [Gluconobacter cerinus]MBS1043474.1 hypothetical protein [Gluconobacter cerinus]
MSGLTVIPTRAEPLKAKVYAGTRFIHATDEIFFTPHLPRTMLKRPVIANG